MQEKRAAAYGELESMEACCACGAMGRLRPLDPANRQGDARIPLMEWRGGKIDVGRLALENARPGVAACPACQHRACVFMLAEVDGRSRLTRGRAAERSSGCRAEAIDRPGAGRVPPELLLRLPIASPAALRNGPRERAERKDGRRVLIVDDDPDCAASLARLTELLGHTVEIAYDGPSAIEKAMAKRPDVVLCDIDLPGMSGYEVAQALRANGTAGMRLIAVSGCARPADVLRAVEAGFHGHVAKPFDPADIERLLARVSPS